MLRERIARLRGKRDKDRKGSGSPVAPTQQAPLEGGGDPGLREELREGCHSYSPPAGATAGAQPVKAVASRACSGTGHPMVPVVHASTSSSVVPSWPPHPPSPVAAIQVRPQSPERVRLLPRVGSATLQTLIAPTRDVSPTVVRPPIAASCVAPANGHPSRRGFSPRSVSSPRLAFTDPSGTVWQTTVLRFPGFASARHASGPALSTPAPPASWASKPYGDEAVAAAAATAAEEAAEAEAAEAVEVGLDMTRLGAVSASASTSASEQSRACARASSQQRFVSAIDEEDAIRVEAMGLATAGRQRRPSYDHALASSATRGMSAIGTIGHVRSNPKWLGQRGGGSAACPATCAYGSVSPTGWPDSFRRRSSMVAHVAGHAAAPAGQPLPPQWASVSGASLAAVPQVWSPRTCFDGSCGSFPSRPLSPPVPCARMLLSPAGVAPMATAVPAATSLPRTPSPAPLGDGRALSPWSVPSDVGASSRMGALWRKALLDAAAKGATRRCDAGAAAPGDQSPLSEISSQPRSNPSSP